MADYTKNYHLKKPLPEEFYDVEDQNSNMDLIDAQMKRNAEDIQQNIEYIHTELDGAAKETTVNEINAKIGESEDSSTKPTIFGKLAELKQIILEKASEIISAVTGFVDKIGNPDDIPPDNTVFGKLQNIGYIKGSDGSLYETIFQDGTKTLPYERSSEYFDYQPQSVDSDGTYIYVLTGNLSTANYLLKIRMSDFQLMYSKSLGVTGSGEIIVDDNYVFFINGSVLYKHSKSDGALIGSVSGVTASDKQAISQDSGYIYTISKSYFYKVAKSNLTYTKSVFTSSYIYSINAESNYLFVVTDSVIAKVSKDNLTGLGQSATHIPAFAPAVTWVYNNYLYTMACNSSVGEIIKYDMNLNKISTISIGTFMADKWGTTNIGKYQYGNYVFLKSTAGIPFKINFTAENELYYAEGSQYYIRDNPQVIRFGTKLLYLNSESSLARFRIVQLNTQQRGVSTIKGYQEVTW